MASDQAHDTLDSPVEHRRQKLSRLRRSVLLTRRTVLVIAIGELLVAVWWWGGPLGG